MRNCKKQNGNFYLKIKCYPILNIKQFKEDDFIMATTVSEELMSNLKEQFMELTSNSPWDRMKSFDYSFKKSDSKEDLEDKNMSKFLNYCIDNNVKRFKAKKNKFGEYKISVSVFNHK